MKTYFVSRSVANLCPFWTKSKYVVPLARSKRLMPSALSAAGWLSRYSNQKAASSLGCGRGVFLDRVRENRKYTPTKLHEKCKSRAVVYAQFKNNNQPYDRAPEGRAICCNESATGRASNQTYLFGGGSLPGSR